jgi:uncharacterized membrane protein YhhN
MRSPKHTCTSLSLAFFYLLYCEYEANNTFLIAAKVSSTALLAYQSYQHHAQKNKLLTAALVFHCAGDLIIELPGDSLVPAMGSFFLGHLFYTLQLKKNCMPLSDINAAKKITLAGIGLYSAFFTGYLTANTAGVVQCAIPLYSAMLAAILVMTCLQKEKSTPLFLAASLYALSDSLIGFNKLVQKTPRIGYVTWAFYYVAQYFLTRLLAYPATLSPSLYFAAR